MKLDEAKKVLTNNGYKLIKESISDMDITDAIEIILAIYNTGAEDDVESLLNNYDEELVNDLRDAGIIEFTNEPIGAPSQTDATYAQLTAKGGEVLKAIVAAAKSKM